MGLKVGIRLRAPLERIWLRHGKIVEVDDLPQAAIATSRSGARQANGKRQRIDREFWLTSAGEDMAGARLLMAEIWDSAERRGLRMERSRIGAQLSHSEEAAPRPCVIELPSQGHIDAEGDA